jgi:hypothetical protein
VQKVKAHLERPPRPLSESRPDVPPALVKIIDRMMAKDAAERFQSPAKVAAALVPFLSAPPKPPRRKKWLAVAAGACFVAALLAGVIIYVQTDNGTIVIETNDPNIAVMIEKAGGVKIVDQANNREYHLRPGNQGIPSGDYRIEVTEALAGLDLQVTKFELKRGQEVRLSAKIVAKGGEGIRDPVLTANERKQAKERLDTLKGLAALKEQQYELGSAELAELLAAKSEVAKAELLVAETEIDRVKARERILALAQDLVKLLEARLQLGTAELGEVLAAKSEVAKAELALAESDADRVKAHERIVALAQDVVKMREARFEIGIVLQADVLQAKADLLVAQNDLNRAKAKTMTQGSVLPKQAVQEQAPTYRGNPAAFWLGQLNDTDPKFRKEAVLALGDLSQKNEELIPVLVTALRDKDWGVGKEASKALAYLGPKVFPVLVEVLKDKKSPSAISRAAEAVAIIGRQANPAVPLLSQQLNIDNEVEWRCAIIALARIGAAAKPAIPAMIDFLGDFIRSTEFLEPVKSRPKMPSPAEGGYMWMEPMAPAIVQALLAIDPEIKDILPKGVFAKISKDNLQWRLSSIAPAAVWQETYEALKKKYQGQKLTNRADHQGDQGAGKEASQEQGPLYRGKPTAFWLNQLKDADPNFRVEAVEVLGKLSQKNEELIPVLVTALDDVDLKVGKEASKALGSLGPKVVPALLEVLKHNKSPNAISRAADAVGYIGPKAEAAVPLLSQSLKMDNEVQWQSPIYALGRIGPAAKPAIPAMIDFFGEYLKSKEFLESKAFGGNKKNAPGIRPHPLVVTLMVALLQIDPAIKRILPEGIHGEGAFSYLGVNMNVPAALWQEAYDSLKKNYQKQKPKDPASKDSLTEGRGERLPQRRSLELRVTDSQVIVVATALDSAPAPPKRHGGEASNTCH